MIKKNDDIFDDITEIRRDVKEHNTILSDIRTILAVQAEQLKYHIARTDLAEENIKLLREEVKPMQRHVYAVNIVFKIATAIAGTAAFLYVVLQIIDHLS